MVDVYLALGSNLGDRAANIDEALHHLDLALGAHYLALSSVIETPACGFEGPFFLNCAVHYRTSLSPEALLLACKDIERLMGRSSEGPHFDADGHRLYSDRPIDIDILLYGHESINTPKLTIPHPRMKERDFVMRPLREIFNEND